MHQQICFSKNRRICMSNHLFFHGLFKDPLLSPSLSSKSRGTPCQTYTFSSKRHYQSRPEIQVTQTIIHALDQKKAKTRTENIVFLHFSKTNKNITFFYLQKRKHPLYVKFSFGQKLPDLPVQLQPCSSRSENPTKAFSGLLNQMIQRLLKL